MIELYKKNCLTKDHLEALIGQVKSEDEQFLSVKGAIIKKYDEIYARW